MGKDKIIIFFRKDENPNVFRELILEALNADFGKYIICSAFFQEPQDIGGSFSTSKALLNELSNNNQNKEIDIFGIYNHYGKWKRSYDTFCMNMKNNLSHTHSINFYKFKNKSHAKVMIVKENKSSEYCLAIIGSSNLSAGAFNIPNKNWNQECDVIFYNARCPKATLIINKILENRDNSSDLFFITNYDEEHRLNKISISEKLQLLEESIRANSSKYSIE